MSADTPQPTRRQDHASVGEVVEFVKTYAKQETVDPLKNAGRFIAFGSAGAIALGLGLSLVLLGVLRLVQTELSDIAEPDSKLNWLPYLIVLVVAAILIVLTVARVKKNYLDKDDKR